jgi:hypothetical protein
LDFLFGLGNTYEPKFVFAMLLLALLVLGAAFFLKQHLGNAATPPPVNESVTPAPVVSVAPPPAPAPSSAAPASTITLTPEQLQAAIDAETDRLQEWSMNDDPASLSNILADLTNSEKEIRDAAIEAAKQFGSTNAIPTLKVAAESTDDLQEKIAYLEAADFLSLPSINFDGSATQRTPEQIQAEAQRRRSQRAARRQAQMQRHAPNQNSQSASDQSTTPPSDPNSSGASDN